MLNISRLTQHSTGPVIHPPHLRNQVLDHRSLHSCSSDLVSVEHKLHETMKRRHETLNCGDSIRTSPLSVLQVNLKRPCPFWPDDGHCSIKDCHVEPCPEVRGQPHSHLFNKNNTFQTFPPRSGIMIKNRRISVWKIKEFNDVSVFRRMI